MKPQIYRIKDLGQGFLAAMAKPVPGEFVEDEFRGIAGEGIHRVVSLLERGEAYELGLQSEPVLVQKNKMEFVSFPIADMNLPASLQAFHELTFSIYNGVLGGRNTVVHCRAGIGRTGMVTAGVLLHAGLAPQEAFTLISEKRGVAVPDTEEQREWVVANCNAIVAGVRS